MQIYVCMYYVWYENVMDGSHNLSLLQFTFTFTWTWCISASNSHLPLIRSHSSTPWPLCCRASTRRNLFQFLITPHRTHHHQQPEPECAEGSPLWHSRSNRRRCQTLPRGRCAAPNRCLQWGNRRLPPSRPGGLVAGDGSFPENQYSHRIWRWIKKKPPFSVAITKVAWDTSSTSSDPRSESSSDLIKPDFLRPSVQSPTVPPFEHSTKG